MYQIEGQKVILLSIIYILKYSSMLLRKTRKHFHGSSNRTLYTSKLKYHPTQISAATAKTIKDTLSKKSSETYFFPRKQFIERSGNKTEVGQDVEQRPEVLRTTQLQLRKKYRGCKNIGKVLNRWGFTGKGCISREQFKQQLSRRIGQSFDNEAADQLFSQYCETEKGINVQGLISMLFGKTQGVPFDNRIFSTKEDSTLRNKLVQDLKQNIKNFQIVQKKELNDITINTLITKINSAISMMKRQQISLPESKQIFFQEVKKIKKFNHFQNDLLDHIEKSMNFTEMRNLAIVNDKVDSLFTDPLVRKVRKIPLIDREKRKFSDFNGEQTEILFNKMRSSPDFFSTLCSQDKRKQFDPLALININQGKTRFQRSVFTSQSNGWRSNIHSESVCPNQKEIVINQLRKQQQIRKNRYQNKLKNMKSWRDKQNETIASRQFETQKRQQGRLQRIRNQQQAYNYINFIKKKWE